ncbi:histidine ammonia-lyase [bacterium]|nr:histidine ammonia-lyase [bacterium]
MEIILDGFNLKAEELYEASQLALDPNASLKIVIADDAKERIQKAAKFVKKITEGDEAVYGINTGFGKFAEVRIDHDKLNKLQTNLILSHAVGVGENLPRNIVMMMWILRLNVMCRGNSGIRLKTVEQLIKLLECGILSDVPCKGSVGASGDLAPSAHATLALLGVGYCSYPHVGSFHKGTCKDALSQFGLSPWKLVAKEGLSLINGTQLTTAYSVIGLIEGRRALKHANLSLALSIEALQASHLLFDDRILEVRNQLGPVEVAKDLKFWLSGESEIKHDHENCDRVQDPYSLRCAPQVHGAIHDELSHAETIINRELNSSTDNPLLFPDDEESLSGGNFHALYTARVNDNLASAFATLANISERRIAHMMSRESNRLYPFLIIEGGFNSGLMMAQVTAAALVSESKAMSFPASVDSIPTSDDKEDHVSMGPLAGQKLMTCLENLNHVLSIEIMSACQALDLRFPLKSTKQIQKAHAIVRKDVDYLEKDRVLHRDLVAISKIIKSQKLLKGLPNHG